MRKGSGISFLIVPALLGGCLGEGGDPAGPVIPSHPIHGSWFTELGAEQPYAFRESEYRPDGALLLRDYQFRRDSVTGLLVLDTVHFAPHRIVYSADGEYLTERYYRTVKDSLVFVQHFRFSIRGDTLSRRICDILLGRGNSLEGRWEAILGGYSLWVMEFRGGMWYDSIFKSGEPPGSRGPRAYRVLDDSTYILDAGADSQPDTVEYRIRDGRLILPQDAYRTDMFRSRPADP